MCSLFVFNYCNSPLCSISAFNLKKLQRVQNLAARFALDDWITPPNTLLSKLHWLPVYSRIKFKISTITFKLLVESQPANLRSLIDSYAPTRLLRSYPHIHWQAHLISVYALLVFGTPFHSQFDFSLHSHRSNKIWKLSILPHLKSPANPLGLRFSFKQIHLFIDYIH